MKREKNEDKLQHTDTRWEHKIGCVTRWNDKPNRKEMNFLFIYFHQFFRFASFFLPFAAVIVPLSYQITAFHTVWNALTMIRVRFVCFSYILFWWQIRIVEGGASDSDTIFHVIFNQKLWKENWFNIKYECDFDSVFVWSSLFPSI